MSANPLPRLDSARGSTRTPPRDDSHSVVSESYAPIPQHLLVEEKSFFNGRGPGGLGDTLSHRLGLAFVRNFHGTLPYTVPALLCALLMIVVPVVYSVPNTLAGRSYNAQSWHWVTQSYPPPTDTVCEARLGNDSFVQRPLNAGFASAYLVGGVFVALLVALDADVKASVLPTKADLVRNPDAMPPVSSVLMVRQLAWGVWLSLWFFALGATSFVYHASGGAAGAWKAYVWSYYGVGVHFVAYSAVRAASIPPYVAKEHPDGSLARVHRCGGCELSLTAASSAHLAMAFSSIALLVSFAVDIALLFLVIKSNSDLEYESWCVLLALCWTVIGMVQLHHISWGHEIEACFPVLAGALLVGMCSFVAAYAHRTDARWCDPTGPIQGSAASEFGFSVALILVHLFFRGDRPAPRVFVISNPSTIDLESHQQNYRVPTIPSRPVVVPSASQTGLRLSARLQPSEIVQTAVFIQDNPRRESDAVAIELLDDDDESLLPPATIAVLEPPPPVVVAAFPPQMPMGSFTRASGTVVPQAMHEITMVEPVSDDENEEAIVILDMTRSGGGAPPPPPLGRGARGSGTVPPAAPPPARKSGVVDGPLGGISPARRATLVEGTVGNAASSRGAPPSPRPSFTGGNPRFTPTPPRGRGSLEPPAGAGVRGRGSLEPPAQQQQQAATPLGRGSLEPAAPTPSRGRGSLEPATPTPIRGRGSLEPPRRGRLDEILAPGSRFTPPSPLVVVDAQPSTPRGSIHSVGGGRGSGASIASATGHRPGQTRRRGSSVVDTAVDASPEVTAALRIITGGPGARSVESERFARGVPVDARQISLRTTEEAQRASIRTLEMMDQASQSSGSIQTSSQQSLMGLTANPPASPTTTTERLAALKAERERLLQRKQQQQHQS